ncbi:MAG: NAD(P)/FAD-dependent oxidoreductase [Polyangiaceae bacterium]|nr:NAD(P)/FAD-dependent oxidoreductase [Polyangiaceae bacterium]
MKHLLILGAGTAGTMVANRMVKKLPQKEWQVTVVDPDTTHLYQPGLLFLPFGNHEESELVRPRAATLDDRVEWKQRTVLEIDSQARSVVLDDGERLAYDLLVIASGSRIRPDLTEGLLGDAWQRSVFDFYTLDGAVKLRDALAKFRGGKLVINLVELPIKCPVAPLEFAFLADEFFVRQGIRDEVELTYVTPLDGAFTKPIASKRLGHLLHEKNVKVETEFAVGSVTDHELVSFDERRVPFDLLVTIPTHTGAAFVERSGLGNELAFIPTDKHSLAAKGLDNVFVVGDATDVPASKAGSVAHFEAETLIENLERAATGRALASTFDGHANCFVETGGGKALLIDFNYDVEPLPGKYPLPGLGPFSLLEESKLNHQGKLAFRWIYWNGLLPGKPIPVPAQMSLAGKEQPDAP